MSIFQLDTYENFIQSLTASTLHDQWHARVAKIGPRFFAALGQDRGLWAHSLVFKTTPFSYEIMCGQPGIKRAPYTQSTWLAVDQQSELTEDDLRLYIAQSYKIVANGLTKVMRNKLGVRLDFSS